MISSIVANRVLSGKLQRVREKHVDDNSKVHYNTYDCAIDADTDVLLDLHASTLENSIATSEASQASTESNAIAATTHADIKTVALAFLRKAYDQDESYQAYIRFDRFNTYRLAQGWTTAQVVANLSEVGLTQDEWDLILARYNYLFNATRITAIEDYRTVLDGDTWRND